jgi:hypothetical protein
MKTKTQHTAEHCSTCRNSLTDYTSGPLTVYPVGSMYHHRATSLEITTPGGQTTASIDRKLNPNADADAVLYAAAPDLLEAAKASYKEITALGHPEDCKRGCPGCRLRAAISKAEGR